MRARRRAVRGV
ncbi:hypothetical protein STRIP9103_08013, partial [Streptomyces ipomoeae 91-03]